MLKVLFLVLITLTATIFTACSTKEVFKPIDVAGNWKNFGSSEVTIKDISPDAALVEDRKVLATDKVLDVKIPQNHKLLGYSDGWVISASIDGDLTLQSANDSTRIEKFELKRTIAIASVKDDVLAVLFTNNEMALYSIATKTLLLKEQGDAPIVVNSKIVKPYFRDDIVIFSTLDGKIVVINSKIKKKLRTIIVSSEDYFNNIIYFNLVNNKIVTATGHKLLSLAEKEIRANHDIRNVLSDDKNIYIATKQGDIISLTSELKQNAKLKFPFAHFLGMIVSDDKLYVLEKEGYIIEISKDFSKYTVYDVSINDGYVFISDKIFYVDDEYISVE
ncbi:MAG: PQQ-like beta-propeller repeat protein [Sulfurimonas sp.]|nr:PQQ-like beta-propeller repeat protein [Sulfurimonas sp.]